jgi:hypothetical protein
VFSTFPTRKSQRETGFFRRRDSTHFYFYEQEHFFLSTRVGWSFRLEFLRILKRAYRRRTNSALNLNRIAATSLRAKRSAAHWPKKTDEKLKFNRCDWTSTFTAKLFPSSLRDKSNFSLFIISNKMSSVLKRQRERERERKRLVLISRLLLATRSGSTSRTQFITTGAWTHTRPVVGSCAAPPPPRRPSPPPVLRKEQRNKSVKI